MHQWLDGATKILAHNCNGYKSATIAVEVLPHSIFDEKTLMQTTQILSPMHVHPLLRYLTNNCEHVMELICQR